MKKIISAIIMVLISLPAFGAVKLSFNDGTANIWRSYYSKGNQYCTQLSIGEYCVLKKDVVSIKTAKDGDEPSEYGMSSLGDASASQRRQEAAEINDKTVSEMDKNRMKNERDIEADARRERERINKNRKEGKADWAQ